MAGLGLRPAFACSNQIQFRKNDVSKLLHHAGLCALHYLHVSPVSEVSFNSKLRLSVYVVFTDTISSFGLVHCRQILRLIVGYLVQCVVATKSIIKQVTAL
jgi:hypothetical protein